LLILLKGKELNRTLDLRIGFDLLPPSHSFATTREIPYLSFLTADVRILAGTSEH
jgi:hypothetical protein